MRRIIFYWRTPGRSTVVLAAVVVTVFISSAVRSFRLLQLRRLRCRPVQAQLSEPRICYAGIHVLDLCFTEARPFAGALLPIPAILSLLLPLPVAALPMCAVNCR